MPGHDAPTEVRLALLRKVAERLTRPLPPEQLARIRARRAQAQGDEVRVGGAPASDPHPDPPVPCDRPSRVPVKP